MFNVPPDVRIPYGEFRAEFHRRMAAVAEALMGCDRNVAAGVLAAALSATFDEFPAETRGLACDTMTEAMRNSVRDSLAGEADGRSDLRH